MRIARPRLLALLALIGLADCGAPQTGSVSPPQAVLRQVGPDARAGDLLYATMGRRVVIILSYPGGKELASFHSEQEWPKVCSDPASGDVYVDGDNKMYRYEHGATKPMAALSAPSGYETLDGCSVDPASGDLAVVNAGDGGDDPPALLVYPRGSLVPQVYVDKKVLGFYYCGYDDRGNIFVLGYRTDSKYVYPVLTELPKGGDGFMDISLDTYLQYPQKLEWDGTNLALTLGHTIYQVHVSGSSGTVVGTTQLVGDEFSLGGESWVEGGSVVAPYDPDRNRQAAIWAYPTGGLPKKVLHSVSHHRNGFFVDFTISRAPHRRFTMALGER